jgi:hypothetical protein
MKIGQGLNIMQYTVIILVRGNIVKKAGKSSPKPNRRCKVTKAMKMPSMPKYFGRDLFG